jgi:hypothetical protein
MTEHKFILTVEPELFIEDISKIMKQLNIEPKLSIEDINARIKQEVCYGTLEELTDTKLMCEYKDCKSVKNEILGKYIDEETKQKIIQDYLLQLIPAGTKGVIRGNKFNQIVNQFITKLACNIVLACNIN